MATNKTTSSKPRSLLFDLMGTCLDWHTSITQKLKHILQDESLKHGVQAPSDENISLLALKWREGFFEEIHERFKAGKDPEDIDETHRRVLKRLLEQSQWNSYAILSDQAQDDCVASWHNQQAWPDVQAALPSLCALDDVIVLANGTTRFQLDLAHSSGLNFDLLLSSELLAMTKPDPEIYRKAMSLLKRDPHECVMIAAHAYDLRAAKKVGMQTVYIQRWSEDRHEDMEVVKAENDFFIDARNATGDAGGLLEVVEILRKAGCAS